MHFLIPKIRACLFLVIIMIVASCSLANKKRPSDFIQIDVLEAFAKQKSMKLSDFVSDIELVKFEDSKDAYFRSPYSYSIGKKYIMVADAERDRVILFDRTGKFIREVGRRGKGPGEFNNTRTAVMDPSEQYIYIADWTIRKLIQLTVTGAFVREIDTSTLFPMCAVDGIKFINDDQFVLVLRRPFVPIEGYASLLLFNKNLESVQKILPRANDKNLCLCVNPNGVLGNSEHRITFWEPYFDTLYTITPAGKSIPTYKIGFSKGGPTWEFASTNFNPNLTATNAILSIIEFGNYLQISGSKKGEWFTALYNTKSREIFELSNPSSCQTSKGSSYQALDNDIFGVSLVKLKEYAPAIQRMVCWVRPDDLTSFDLSCIKAKKVKSPSLRDRFLDIAQNPDSAGQVLLVLMKLK